MHFTSHGFRDGSRTKDLIWFCLKISYPNPNGCLLFSHLRLLARFSGTSGNSIFLVGRLSYGHPQKR